MLKAEAWPLSRDAPGWRADAIDFRRQARDAFTPSMRQRIDLAGLYADALAATPETLDGQAPLPVARDLSSDAGRVAGGAVSACCCGVP
jgi:hypothetical protein